MRSFVPGASGKHAPCGPSVRPSGAVSSRIHLAPIWRGGTRVGREAEGLRSAVAIRPGLVGHRDGHDRAAQGDRSSDRRPTHVPGDREAGRLCQARGCGLAQSYLRVAKRVLIRLGAIATPSSSWRAAGYSISCAPWLPADPRYAREIEVMPSPMHASSCCSHEPGCTSGTRISAGARSSSGRNKSGTILAAPSPWLRLDVVECSREMLVWR
jgi:hypothetical protein